MREYDDLARAFARDLLAAIGKTKEPEPLLKRFDRIIAASMPPALAYALGAAKRGYHDAGTIAALLRREGLQHESYSWLTERGDAIAAVFEEAIAAAVPKAAEPEPDSTPAPTAPVELEQPAAPTHLPDPDPTPPGVPDTSPAAMAIAERRLRVSDVAGNPELAAGLEF